MHLLNITTKTCKISQCAIGPNGINSIGKQRDDWEE